jgi:hypothetical protein
MDILACPLPDFERLVRALASARNHQVFVHVGIRETPGEREWLVREVILVSADSPSPQQRPLFRVTGNANPREQLQNLARPSDPGVAGHLFVGEDATRGQVCGVVFMPDGPQPLECLYLPGPGMHQIATTPADEALRLAHEWGDSAVQLNRWSRTIGALGGIQVWQRLVGLKMGVIGCGRTGSLLATALVRLGVRSLTLIDPDVIEAHNLGEMDTVTEEDLGAFKVEALAERLRSLGPRGTTSFQPFPVPVTEGVVRAAVQSCEVLFSCVDNDAARLATALLATLYHRLLIDIGTGIFSEPAATPPGRRTLGADVRLILPHDGCLLCRGNITDYVQAVEDLCHGRLPVQQGGTWRDHRAGLLRSLNDLATGLAVRMLEDLVAEHIETSTWAHLEFSEDGRLSVTYPMPQGNPIQTTCPLCAKAGQGDEALRWTRSIPDCPMTRMI